MAIPYDDELLVAGIYAALIVGVGIIGEVRARHYARTGSRCVACWFNPCRCKKGN
jgi:hypothetical protein